MVDNKMPKQTINLTQRGTRIWIDQIWATYPESLHQTTSKEPDSHNKLMLSVLSRVPDSRVAVNSMQQGFLSQSVSQLYLEQQQQNKNLSHDGISYWLPVDVIQHIYRPPDSEPFNEDVTQYIV
ncbi:hypothetical protein N836_02925 [Leptolyngbya sp. Heron Island J]|uniref:hypothetical protein n=1 Tax=Leptolyngbya sp. Heron Island J TaxID=1385935 RepID=UPI0003B9DD8F|nr:hypothetical protein [Leptolyngbya sp. Heron Island J]ESA37483.1 hypothetical protein N836_02925 [Leptolyngbya sp. Heron Island J]